LKHYFEGLSSLKKILLENLSVRINGNRILNSVTVELEPNTVIGLIGPSGSGKSVLLKVIAGLIPFSSGNLNLNDLDLAKCSLLFQEGALFDSLTVFDNVSFPLVKGKVPVSLLSRKKQNEINSVVSLMLRKVGLEWAAKKMPNELSGGMRRRVSLARALVVKPMLTLLDDPTSGLDPIASSVILDLIMDSQDDQDSTTVIVSHDLRRLLPRVKKLICLFNGEVRFFGSLSELDECACPEVIKFISCRYDLKALCGSSPNFTSYTT
jgi:phospholipid/cholesterol/gamma-HCH transport system ATP-binding protein